MKRKAVATDSIQFQNPTIVWRCGQEAAARWRPIASARALQQGREGIHLPAQSTDLSQCLGPKLFASDEGTEPIVVGGEYKLIQEHVDTQNETCSKILDKNMFDSKPQSPKSKC